MTDPTSQYPPAGGYPPPQQPPSTGPAMSYGSALGYAVDIVFVIDITGSMRPVLEQVKAGAMGFHDQLLHVMATKDKYVSSLRLRVVASATTTTRRPTHCSRPSSSASPTSVPTSTRSSTP